MKFILHLFCPVFVFMLITACRDDHSFTITAQVDHFGAVKKVYLLAADSAGTQLIDSTNLIVAKNLFGKELEVFLRKTFDTHSTAIL